MFDVSTGRNLYFSFSRSANKIARVFHGNPALHSSDFSFIVRSPREISTKPIFQHIALTSSRNLVIPTNIWKQQHFACDPFFWQSALEWLALDEAPPIGSPSHQLRLLVEQQWRWRNLMCSEANGWLSPMCATILKRVLSSRQLWDQLFTNGSTQYAICMAPMPQMTHQYLHNEILLLVL